MVLLVLVFTNVTKKLRSAKEGIDAYMEASLVVFVCSIFCEILVVKAGSVGTMIELEKRNDKLELYLSVHYALTLLQLGLCFWGIAMPNKVFEAVIRDRY